MTICNITGYACDCQPDEGMPCDGIRKLREACEGWKKQSIERGQENERLRAALDSLCECPDGDCMCRACIALERASESQSAQHDALPDTK
jgi:hypothetical protein